MGKLGDGDLVSQYDMIRVEGLDADLKVPLLRLLKCMIAALGVLGRLYR